MTRFGRPSSSAVVRPGRAARSSGPEMPRQAVLFSGLDPPGLSWRHHHRPVRRRGPCPQHRGNASEQVSTWQFQCYAREGAPGTKRPARYVPDVIRALQRTPLCLLDWAPRHTVGYSAGRLNHSRRRSPPLSGQACWRAKLGRAWNPRVRLNPPMRWLAGKPARDVESKRGNDHFS